MSRSTKKPYFTEQNRSKPQKGKAKQNANRKVRNTKEVADGKSYRKVSDSWSIRDWSFWAPKDKKAYRK